MKKFLIIFGCFWAHTIFASAPPLAYGIDAKNDLPKKIRFIQIFGERCTGTNFLEKLLQMNFLMEGIKYEFGWKHFPYWYDSSLKNRENFSDQFVSLKGNEEFLFVVIFRDPYDWLRSFYEHPWHVSRLIPRNSFGHFIRSTWVTEGKCWLSAPVAKVLDRNPENNEYFENVLKLRNARIKNMFKIKKKAKNVYFINYETLRDHPREVLREISSLFNIELRDQFRPVNSYKGDQKTLYTGSNYFSIDQIDLQFINENLDWEVENFINYNISNK